MRSILYVFSITTLVGLSMNSQYHNSPAPNIKVTRLKTGSTTLAVKIDGEGNAEFL